MKRASLPAVLLVIALATGLFYLLIHEVSRTWLSIGLRPEVRESISRSLDDQKALAETDFMVPADPKAPLGAEFMKSFPVTPEISASASQVSWVEYNKQRVQLSERWQRDIQS